MNAVLYCFLSMIDAWNQTVKKKANKSEGEYTMGRKTIRFPTSSTPTITITTTAAAAAATDSAAAAAAAVPPPHPTLSLSAALFAGCIFICITEWYMHVCVCYVFVLCGSSYALCLYVYMMPCNFISSYQ